MAKVILMDGIIEKKSPLSPKRSDIIEFKPLNIAIDFDDFFNNHNIDDIFIFPHGNDLYCLIQRLWTHIEIKGVLEWNEIGMYGNLTPHRDQMINKIDSSNSLYSICSKYFQTFRLYRIPFYFIPIVKETYIACKYGEFKGDWRIIIHNSINLRNNPLDFTIQSNLIKLRPYQRNAIDEWHGNCHFGSVCIATAGGKTILALQCIADLGLTTLIAVPTEPLVLQWADDLKTLNIPTSKIGIFYGKKKQIKPITIGTYASLMKYIVLTDEERIEIEKSYLDEEKADAKIKDRMRYSDILQNYFSLLILDESHHIPAPTFRRLALNSKALNRLSLSATMERYDKNESLLYFSCGKKIFRLSYLELCNEGWVVPFIYKYIPVYLSPMEIDEYKHYGVEIEKKKVLSFFNYQKLANIIQICNAHVKNNDQIFVFVSYVNSAYTIYDELRDFGISCDMILSQEAQKRKSLRSRTEVIEGFKKGDIKVIISTTVLDEGYNVPNANVAIIVSGTSNERQLTQRIGRIVRKSNLYEKIAYVYEITTEGDKDFLTLDQENRLVRNNMIIDRFQYIKEKKLLESEFWTFDYETITDYAIEKANKFNIPIVKF